MCLIMEQVLEPNMFEWSLFSSALTLTVRSRLVNTGAVSYRTFAAGPSIQHFAPRNWPERGSARVVHVPSMSLRNLKRLSSSRAIGDRFAA
jgi:hypothetical protein